MNKEAYGTYLQQRGNHFAFLYNIPKFSQGAGPGKAGLTKSGKPIMQIKKSLGTKDRREALIRIGPEIEHYTRLYPVEPRSFDAAITLPNVAEAAKVNGFDFYTAEKLKTMSVIEALTFMSPILYAENLNQTQSPVEVVAFGGAVEVPALTLTQAFERFKEISPELVSKKTERGTHETWQKFKLAIEDYIKRMGGDVDVLKLERATVKNYRAKLVEAAENGEFGFPYADKRLRTIRQVVGCVLDEYPNEPKNPFADIKPIEGKGGKGIPFSEDDVKAIREKIENSKAGSEVKAMMLVAMNTGTYVSELAKMAPEDIILDGEVPHLKIRLGPFRKELKTDERERDIPLLGIALETMKQFPKGFEARFNDERGVKNLSTACWKFINPLVKETKGKSFKSFRHRFASLLRHRDDDVRAAIFSKDQIQDALMGHATLGLTGYYGTPVLLAQMKLALEKALPEENR